MRPPSLTKSFKSPRECYKLNESYHVLFHFVGFKSPRECYKLNLSRKGLVDLEFQVPKGMLQTEYEKLLEELEEAFQVPKGMLQTIAP